MRHRWTITLLLTPLLLAVVALAVYRCHTVPLSQCSEVYRRYHDTPGIRASFIRDMPVNDTLRLDVTLLEAVDSASFANLLKDWGKSDEYIHDIMTHYFDKNTRYIKLHPKGHPELPKSKIKTENEIVATFPVIRTILVFHTQTEQAIDQIVYSNLQEEIRISNILKAKENEQSN